MDIKILTEKCDALAKARKERNGLKEFIDLRRAQFEKTIDRDVQELQKISGDITTSQDEILATMRNSNLFSWRTEAVTISRKSTTKYIVQDSEKVIGWLKKKKLYKNYTEVIIKSTASEIFKDVAVPGVQCAVHEFISVLNK